MFFSALIIIFFLLNVGLLTLFERKLLGVFHLRLGPNFLFINSLLIFLSDFIKFIFKSHYFVHSLSVTLFYLLPFIKLWVMLFLFILVLFKSFVFYFYLISFILSLFIVLIYKDIKFFVLLYNFNNLYSILASLRFIGVFISIELLSIVLFFILFFIFNFSFVTYPNFYYYVVFFYFIFVLYVFFILNMERLPFDLLESESELVSGSDLEASSFIFLLIFLVEYMLVFFLIYLFFLIVGFSYFFFNSFIFIFLFVILLFTRVLLCRVKTYQLLNIVLVYAFPCLSLVFFNIFFILN